MFYTLSIARNSVGKQREQACWRLAAHRGHWSTGMISFFCPWPMVTKDLWGKGLLLFVFTWNHTAFEVLFICGPTAFSLKATSVTPSSLSSQPRVSPVWVANISKPEKSRMSRYEVGEKYKVPPSIWEESTWFFLCLCLGQDFPARRGSTQPHSKTNSLILKMYSVLTRCSIGWPNPSWN